MKKYKNTISTKVQQGFFIIINSFSRQSINFNSGSYINHNFVSVYMS